MQKFDVAVVGAGIVGLSHAWMAAQRGLKVVLFERSPAAQGASIRNFGMVWPIGQPVGENFALALRSRALWLELSEQAGLWINPCGSLHLAHRQDELAVLEEYIALHRQSEIGVEHLTADETLRRTPAANPNGLLGSMWSPNELCLNPPQAIATIPGWLVHKYGVQCEFNTTISRIDNKLLIASDGRTWQTERTVICSGHDVQTLLPEVFAQQPLTICKLQMMRTVSQKNGWRIGPHLASGLTLRHYSRSFALCPSLPKLVDRVKAETPELDQFGIHVLASQNNMGQVLLGDSHEYDSDITPFDRTEIDALILREARRQFVLPDWTIDSRWHGIYAKHPQQNMLEVEPREGLHVCVGPGGAGMTLSLASAERFWKTL